MKTKWQGIELKVHGPRASLGRVSAVMSNTLRETGRTRAFYGVLIVAMLLLFGSVILSDLALVNQKARLVQDFGLFTIPLVTILTGVLLGVVLLQKEIEKKTLYAILPKPIRRGEFLLGKYLGLCTLLLLEMLVLALCWFAVLALRGGEISAPIFSALLLSYVEVMLITAIATFFSSLSSPLLSGILTLGMFIIGRISYIIVDLMNASKGVFAEVAAMRWLGRGIMVVVPDLSAFNISDELLLGWPVTPEYLLHSIGYGLSYSAIFLVLGLLVFERRDLT
ncbi:MAG TPA: hypothetical protein DCQ06_12810 [Myxococcales bacterium]|nr:hypothetical protein [Myxococcales bacterium]HAN32469.1 hypothetical protein [Myxococcales bacterium]|tara:strand:- start:808 stop:1647 length:840 start_codon:yes stop_codon:yes gene_type:complete